MAIFQWKSQKAADLRDCVRVCMRILVSVHVCVKRKPEQLPTISRHDLWSFSIVILLS